MKVVIFDLDGTLVKLPIKYDKIRKIMRDFFNTNESFVPLIPTIKRLSKNEKIIKDALNIICTEEVYAANEFLIMNGVTELLQSLSSRNFLLAIATMQCRSATEKVLEKMNLTKLFSCVQTRDEHLDKEHQIEEILQILGSNPSDSVVIGDRMNDVEAANKVGCFAVLVSSDKSINSNKNFYRIDELNQIYDISFFG